MRALGDLGRALIGWLDLLAARPEAAAKFDQSRRGLLIATFWYAVAVVITILVQIVTSGVPGGLRLLLELLGNAASLLGLWWIIWLSGRVLGKRIAARPMLVPGTFALAFMLVLGLPILVSSGSTFAGAILGALGFMLYRMARQIGGLGIGLALAFMLLCIVVLVALPAGLYMLGA